MIVTDKAYEEKVMPYIGDDEYIILSEHEVSKEELPKITIFFEKIAFVLTIFHFMAGIGCVWLAFTQFNDISARLGCSIVGIVFIIVPLSFWFYVNIRKNRIYAITNLRAIVLDGDKIKDAKLLEIKKIQTFPIKNNIRTLRLFTCFDLRKNKVKWIEFNNISSSSMAECIIRKQKQLLNNGKDDIDSFGEGTVIYKRK